MNMLSADIVSDSIKKQVANNENALIEDAVQNNCRIIQCPSQ